MNVLRVVDSPFATVPLVAANPPSPVSDINPAAAPNPVNPPPGVSPLPIGSPSIQSLTRPFPTSWSPPILISQTNSCSSSSIYCAIPPTAISNIARPVSFVYDAPPEYDWLLLPARILKYVPPSLNPTQTP